MSEHDVLAKTNRVNVLFDYYRSLLTEKQQTYLQLYFHEDFSLGEIAESHAVSRQAVYEHIKRAEQVLEETERKLGMYTKDAARRAVIQECIALLTKQADSYPINEVLQRLYKLGGDPDGV